MLYACVALRCDGVQYRNEGLVPGAGRVAARVASEAREPLSARVARPARPSRADERRERHAHHSDGPLPRLRRRRPAARATGRRARAALYDRTHRERPVRAEHYSTVLPAVRSRLHNRAESLRRVSA